ncbi:hypothetical protein FH972_015821 [Carpinus fangiana]|uniref:Spt20-like SEP domain-containing protein n=1 Tax=Carpinus fangiana TaxID=176857 RepID=A0A5N6RHJ8_9ROSI|nr:hypothetical protein FH972_015821 [Carpinus fangiana]
MGVSFKVAKAGTRYRPKLLQIEDKDDEDEGKISGTGSKVAEPSNSLNKPSLHSVSEDLEVSFSLNLFPNGFSIGKATELFNDEPKQLHPYDRASYTLFSAIEYGWLPGDLFDNIPCKFVNGALLCEIQDYRNSLPHKGDTAASVENSPIVHKVLLRMRTENVVKEISLISDDSWTYEDLLEIESRILKALQPDLLLNPEPLQDRYCGELLRMKLDLGIAWSWKRRKLSEKIASNTAFSNSYHMTQISGSCAIQNSRSRSGLEYQERGVTSLQHKILSSNLNPQENNVVVEKLSPSNPLTMDNQLADGCKQSVLTALTSSNLGCVPKQHYSYCNSDPTKSISLQLPGSLAESSLAPEQQWKNKLLHQQIVAKKLLGENFQDKSCPLPLVNSSQSVLKDTSRMLAGMLPYTLKQKTAETGFCGSDARKTNDSCFLIDRRNSQSNIQQLEQQPLSPLLRVKTPPTCSLWSQIAQPVNKSLGNGSATQKSESFRNPRVTTGIKCATKSSQHNDSVNTIINSQHNNSLAREASVPTKQKMNYQIKRSNMKVLGSFASMSTSNAANGNSLPVGNGNVCRDKPSETEADSVLNRLLKIEALTQRYGLVILLLLSNSQEIKFPWLIERMVDEGYHMDSHRVETTPLKACDDSSTPQSGVITDATKTTRTVELHRPTLKSGLSPFMFNPTTNSLSAHNATQLPSQNILSRGNLLPPGNIQSALQLLGSCSSNPQLGVASPISPAQWQEIFSKCARLQMQMQQEQRQQELMQRKMLVGGLGVAAGGLGVVQPGGGIQGLGNSNVSSYNNIMGTWGSAPLLMGGHNPWIGSGSQFNNLGSNISSESEMEFQFREMIPTGMPMHTFNLPGSAHNSNNQQQPQQQLNERLHMLQQQEEMKPFLHPPAVTGLTLNVDLPLSQETLQKSYVQPLMSPQQLSPRLAFVRMNSNNMMVSPENPDLSSRMHGKHSWCN